MPNILSPSYRQDDIGAILSTPFGTENVTPLRPWTTVDRIDELPGASTGAASDQPNAGTNAPSAGRTMTQTGVLLLALSWLVGAGLFAWLR